MCVFLNAQLQQKHLLTQSFNFTMHLLYLRKIKSPGIKSRRSHSQNKNCASEVRFVTDYIPYTIFIVYSCH